MTAPPSDLEAAVQAVLSPYAGSLPQSAIDDITAALLSHIHEHTAGELRGVAARIEWGAAEYLAAGTTDLRRQGQAMRSRSIARRLRHRANELHPTTEGDQHHGLVHQEEQERDRATSGLARH